MAVKYFAFLFCCRFLAQNAEHALSQKVTFAYLILSSELMLESVKRIELKRFDSRGTENKHMTKIIKKIIESTRTLAL